MKTNQLGINLIKEFEGLHQICGTKDGERLVETYHCPSGVLTIGYGTTGFRVRPGLIIPESKAEQWLAEDLEYFEKAVKRLVKIKLNENQFSALVSFTYNCGEGALSSSTALKRLNEGRLDEFVEELQRWNKGNFGVLQGLVRRRKAEGELFSKAIPEEKKLITVLHTTPLKPSTEPLSSLDSKEIEFIPASTKLEAWNVERAGSHLKVELDFNRRGFLYSGHICFGTPVVDYRNEVNLKVPFFSQLDNKFKPHSSCLATSVAMVCAFLGEKPSNPATQMEDEFYLWLEKNKLNRFAHDNMTKVFNACGYKNTFKVDASWEEVKEHLRKGNPVIYSGTLTHSGHIIVIRGFSESKQCWYVNDPYGEYFAEGYNTKLTGEDLEYSYGLLARKSMTGSLAITWAHFPSK